MHNTHHAATREHDAETVDDAGRADHPRQPDEQYDAEDVLYARQVHADQRAHPGRSRRRRRRLAVGVRHAGYGVGIVGDRVEERRHPRPVVHFFLRTTKDRVNDGGIPPSVVVCAPPKAPDGLVLFILIHPRIVISAGFELGGTHTPGPEIPAKSRSSSRIRFIVTGPER